MSQWQKLISHYKHINLIKYALIGTKSDFQDKQREGNKGRDKQSCGEKFLGGSTVFQTFRLSQLPSSVSTKLLLKRSFIDADEANSDVFSLLALIFILFICYLFYETLKKSGIRMFWNIEFGNLLEIFDS